VLPRQLVRQKRGDFAKGTQLALAGRIEKDSIGISWTQQNPKNLTIMRRCGAAATAHAPVLAVQLPV